MRLHWDFGHCFLVCGSRDSDEVEAADWQGASGGECGLRMRILEMR
jgi:hypothetical protein